MTKQTDNINEQLHRAMHPSCEHDPEWTGTLRGWACKKCGETIRSDDTIPAYDSDLTAAFELVEWIQREKGWPIFIRRVTSEWLVELLTTAGDETRSLDKSLPKAISLACAKALGIQTED